MPKRKNKKFRVVKPIAMRPASEPAGRSVVLWQRARAMGDPKLGCEIGRLHFAHKVTHTELLEAAHCAEIYGAYERMAGLKRSNRSPSYEVGYGGGGETAEGMRDGQATRKWTELQSQIPLSPPWLQGAFEQLVVEDRHIGENELNEVRALLAALARFYKAPSEKRKPGPRPQRMEKPSTGATKLPFSNFDREALDATLLRVNPNLVEIELLEAWTFFSTWKFRERFRREKAI